MRKKERAKNNRIVREMKQCVRSLHLSAMEPLRQITSSYPCDFISQIQNEHVQATLMVKYDREREWININMTLGQIPSRKLTEVFQLFNLVNAATPLNQYSSCPCCNEVSVYAHLSAPGGLLPKDKFTRLMRHLLEETYFVSPLIAEVAADGDATEVYQRFIDDHKEVIAGENNLTAEAECKILEIIKSALLDLDVSLSDRDRVDHGYIMDLAHPEDQELSPRLGIQLSGGHEMLVMSMATPSPVPQEKMDTVAELVNRINRTCFADNAYISRPRGNVVLHTAIMLDKGMIDREEFKRAVQSLVTDGFRWLPIINEQFGSNESPSALVRKLIHCYSDKLNAH